MLAQNFIGQIDHWRQENISDRQFVLLLAFIVGFLASVAAYILHIIIGEIESLITSGFRVTTINWLYASLSSDWYLADKSLCEIRGA